MDRREILLSLFDANGFGLEVGPSYNPLLPKAAGYNVETVDYADAAALREKYRDDPHADPARIEEVTYVSDGRSLAELIGDPGRYDYIFASHVIEHVTDIIGFLKDCQTLLKPRGVLVLAVPDKRFCFDALRPLSTVGQAIQTHVEQPNRHSPGMIFDHFSLVSQKAGNIVWIDQTLDDMAFGHDLKEAVSMMETARSSDRYIDIHRWQFIPNHFRYFVKTLRETGFIELGETAFRKNPLGQINLHEFYIVLSKSAPPLETPSLELIRTAETELREIHVSRADHERILRGEEAVRSADALREELAEERRHKHILLNSTSWKITAPLRRVASLLRGGRAG